MVRRVGAAVLAVAAIAVWLFMGPSSDRGNAVEEALAEYELNEARTQGAPQQAVVNGWVAKDLLAIIAEEGEDNRPAALLALLVLGMALVIITSPPAASAEDVEVSGPSQT